MSVPDPSLVAGMGDEVLLFAATMVLGALVALAWCSTAVRERPRVRAVLLQPVRPGVVVAEQVEEADARRRHREAREAGATASLVFAEGAGEGGAAAGTREGRGGEGVREEVRDEEEAASAGEEGAGASARTEDVLSSEDGCRQRQRQREEPGQEAVQSATKSSGVSSLPSPSSSASASAQDDSLEQQQEEDSSSPSSSSVPPITIKLKFLNDSQREVRAVPSESLGGFKRRHFADDLASNKVVRLIFNGQMLRGDRESLSHYGLFDNCVVHCLVSSGEQQRQQQHQQQQQQGEHLFYPGEQVG